MKDIIIFGAGKYGKQCLEKYGDKVAYFSDNDRSKGNTEYEGRRVLPFSEYIELCHNYHTIIAMSHFAEVSEQIDELCGGEYSFYVPEFENQIYKISELIKSTKNRIVFLGVSDGTRVLFKNLKFLGAKIDGLILTDKPDSNNIGTYFCGHEVKPVTEAIEESDVIIVSSPERAYALRVYAKHELNNNEIINLFVRSRYYDEDQIIINRYEGTHDKSEEEYIQSENDSRTRKYIREFAEELSKDLPLFDFIEIETVNWCNGLCEFCPVSVPNNIREKVLMKEDVFCRIIDQLSEMDYSGRLALFSNGEPFLDSRIIKFHRYAREKCPKARMHLFTNGTLLSMDKFLAIVDYLDELIIDNYDQNLKLIRNSEKIYQYCLDHEELKRKVSIVLRKPKEILTSRGGDSPNRTKQAYFPDDSCALPFKQITVRAEGKVSLCCNDVMGKVTLGDLCNERLIDIWYGEKFEAVRRALLNGRNQQEICRFCDAFSFF